MLNTSLMKLIVSGRLLVVGGWWLVIGD